MKEQIAVNAIAAMVYCIEDATPSSAEYAFSLASPFAAVEIMNSVKKACHGRATANSPVGGDRRKDISMIRAAMAAG